MISDSLRTQLLVISGRVPDGDEDSDEPLVAQFGFPRVSAEDADEILAYEDLVEWVASLVDEHGNEKTERLLMIYAKLLKTPSAMETLQLVQRSMKDASATTDSTAS
jgi:hypothetical protein